MTQDVHEVSVVPRQAGPVAQRDDEVRQLDRVRAELLKEFADRLSAAEVERLLDETVGRFSDAPIRSFVPVLARRSVRRELTAAAGTPPV